MMMMRNGDGVSLDRGGGTNDANDNDFGGSDDEARSEV